MTSKNSGVAGVRWMNHINSWSASYRGETKTFSARKYGEAAALNAAKAARKAMESSNPARERTDDSPRATLGRGQGVYWEEFANRWIVCWRQNGERRTMHFEVDKYGKSGAMRKAVQFKEQIESKGRVSTPNAAPLALGNGDEPTKPKKRDRVPSQSPKAPSRTVKNVKPTFKKRDSIDTVTPSQPALLPKLPLITNTFNISSCEISFFGANRDE